MKYCTMQYISKYSIIVATLLITSIISLIKELNETIANSWKKSSLEKYSLNTFVVCIEEMIHSIHTDISMGSV